MKIIAITTDSETRHFLAPTPHDMDKIALKLLNERRIVGQDDEKLKKFIEHITNEQDGDLARSLVSRLYGVETIQPEIV